VEIEKTKTFLPEVEDETLMKALVIIVHLATLQKPWPKILSNVREEYSTFSVWVKDRVYTSNVLKLDFCQGS